MHSLIPFVAGSAIILASQALAGMMGGVISATALEGTAITGLLPTGTTDTLFTFTATVTDSVEYQFRIPPPHAFGIDVDISDLAIRINFYSSSAAVGWMNIGPPVNPPNYFYGYVFRDVNHLIPAFTGFSIGAMSPGVPYTGNSNSNFGLPWMGQLYVLDEDTLVLNLAGLAGPDNTFIEFNVATVPAPGAAMLLGVAGVIARRRR